MMKLRQTSIWLLALATLLLTGCTTHHLAEYDYRGRTAAVVSHFPPHPEVLTGDFAINTENWVTAAISIGTGIAKEVSASKAHKRLRAAMNQIDVSEETAARLEQHIAKRLDLRVVAPDDPADFVLEVFIQDYGISAQTWDSGAYFYVDAEVFLMDDLTGKQIWKKGISAEEGLSSSFFLGPEIQNVISAAKMAELSTEEMVEILTILADYTAKTVAEKLRKDWIKARR